MATINAIRPTEAVMQNNSENYVLIDSTRVIFELEKFGYVVSKIVAYHGCAGKHTVIMRRVLPCVIPGMYPVIVFHNSYDRKSAFEVTTGLVSTPNNVRLDEPIFCAYANTFKCRHIGESARIAQDIVLYLSDQLPFNIQAIVRMNEYQMSIEEIKAVCQTVADKMWNVSSIDNMDMRMMLNAVSVGNSGSTAWSIFNRLVKNLQIGVKVAGRSRRSVAAKEYTDVCKMVSDIVYNIISK